MGGEETLTLLATVIAFGLISVSFYLLVLRPILPEPPLPDARERRRNDPPTRPGRGQPVEPVDAAQPEPLDGNVESILSTCMTCPSHVDPASQSRTGLGGANLLVDGLVAFRHTRAATFEQSKVADGDTVAQNRKDRAKVLAKIFSLEGGGGSGAATASLPPRGSTIVISIPCADVSCPKLRRVLYLIATHYNLLVIMVVSESTKLNGIGDYIQQLRGDGEGDILDEQVLPNHRIVAASSNTGRIAFVRQLARAEIVLDFDSEGTSAIVSCIRY